MKKSCGKKTDKLSHKQKEKILWTTVILISGIIFIGWMYIFINSMSVKISDKQEKKPLPQITDLKKQLEDIKNQFNEFNLKVATSSDAETKNIQKEFSATSTKTNSFNSK
ncbi:MAG: hypothetical protein U9O66_02335 [Patescibacteria group bacterium]|nr:hypothetical protein [Patescibacteria group bacterium]